MDNMTLIVLLLILMGVAYQLGLTRSRAVASTTSGRMNSRPGYYGWLVALWCGLPALLVFVLWTLLEPSVIRSVVFSQLPPEMANLPSQQAGNLMRRLGDIASGYGVSGDPAPYEVAAAETLARLRGIGELAKIAVMASLALAGLFIARGRIRPQLRARTHVEKVINAGLLLCSGVAILTTVGIVFSMFGEAMRFFSFVHPLDFFFGTTWNPRFSSTGHGNYGDFGLLPLLWGTLMISIIALLVAVPVGLMTAIYMSEYAPSWLRSFAKPVIEVLAGIPTIVYGVFALMVVGPFFSSLGDMVGIQIRSTSALTAGFVMGVMIIPFVSSLSDDIISQVPQSLRDGSLGMGATKSETIRQVVLPAALPGIVGAFLLAASRAIGETMIVVLAAGNSPILHANPFEAVSTVTVTIVNQLTGDTDFASPQSLVAFALGLTLFVITLGLNVVALYIVRKYREQYD
ncbi:phosphate ABC transporter permease subunit PstC [Alloalcanivorax gelatiniphagus]|uniref:Phosphate transport system permease protein n=1 Tax=Alloalcanivorax gelatiniphagus TaxID=1194167 RepID=A0ABY2XI64_9GAMM|nr:phosphate ABC transporter permease subunit PstC [Alloalcanivorax gelatiniphagus]TMW11446.1 phosphate ABC transporter permease subunit PstC [Alloalcanivorax gelatiniphagus]|tara:strand:- start:4325 stop:5701 length:1377 start_codon:yes stop_codon:yes gene_type:complete